MQYDGAVLDRQFNNRELVPDWSAWVRGWKQASQDARLDNPCRLDLAYGPTVAQTLDWFPAQVPGPAPCLVFIHGGWWRAFDKADHSFVAPAFARKGAHVAVLNYPLAPSAGMDRIALDIVQALVWIWRRADQLDVLCSRIALAGHSAGGHLAALMLACRFDWIASDLPAQLPCGALSISGVFDLEAIRATPFLQRDLHLTQRMAEALSPARMPPAGPAPLALAVGADESAAFHAQARLMQHAWKAQAGPVQSVAGCHHFSVLNTLATPNGVCHAMAAALLGLAPP